MARNTSRHITLPEPSQIELSGASRYKPRHDRFFDVAVATEAFERFDHVGRGPLADPELADCRRDAGEGSFLLVRGSPIVGPRQPRHQCRRSF